MVVRYERMVVKNRVHPTGKLTCAPDRAGFMFLFFQLPLDAKLRNGPVWGPRSICILRTPPVEASVDPLWCFPPLHA